MPRCTSRYQSGAYARHDPLDLVRLFSTARAAGGSMTVKSGGGRAASPAARAFRGDSKRAGTLGQLSRADRVALGMDARGVTPRESHAEFQPGGSRDPVGLLLEQSKSRVPDLVPIRHGRMLVSAFTFYRGAALPMAADLATTPTSGLHVQLCGDAHLSNFGAYASPERELVFDVNDFDETLPGPFEWDVKRLAASLAVAGRDNGFGGKDRRQIELAAAESYRTAMRAFAGQNFMDVWYARLAVDDLLERFGSKLKPRRLKEVERSVGKAEHKDSMRAFAKLTKRVNGGVKMISDPPL